MPQAGLGFQFEEQIVSANIGLRQYDGHGTQLLCLAPFQKRLGIGTSFEIRGRAG